MTQIAGFYAFQNITCSIKGPGGFIDLAYGSGAAEEGLTFEPLMDKTVVEPGADGLISFSASAVTAHTITARFLKVGPASKTLQLMATLQQATPALNGTNILTLRDIARGDTILCEAVAFTKWTTLNYAKDAGTNEWTFVAARVQRFLG